MNNMTIMQTLHFVKVAGKLKLNEDKNFVYQVLVGSRGDEKTVSRYFKG